MVKQGSNTKKFNRKRRDILQLLAGLLVLILINVLATYQFTRVDLTAEKRFSLSDSTINILRNLQDVVLVDVYLDGKDLPVGFRRLQNATSEVLDEFKRYGRGNFEFRFIDPFDETRSVEDKKGMYKELTDRGLVPTNIMIKTEQGRANQVIFPGAIVSYKEKQIAVQLLKSQMNQNSDLVLNQSIEYLEYEFSKALYKLLHERGRKKVAFSVGHGETAKPYLYDAALELGEFYEMFGVEIAEDLDVLNPVDVLIVNRPTAYFDDASKFIIDQHIMNGKSVLWLVDNVDVSMDSLRTSNFTIAMPYNTNLFDQLFKYGVRVNNTIIQDAQSASIKVNTGRYGTQDQEDFYPWYYYPVIVPSSDHPLSKNISALKMEFVSSLDTIAVPDVKKTILLSTSNLTKVLNMPTRVALSSIEERPTAERFNKPNQPVAVLLEGKFRSVFGDRILQKTTRQASLVSPEETKMIVVSDGDFIKNAYNEARQSTLPMGMDPISGAYYPGNKNFLLNAVNYLSGDSWFIALRSKEFKVRPLEKTKVTTQGKFWKIANTAIPVVIVCVFGLVYNLVRKRRFAH